MKDFQTAKNGYNKEEVMMYINELHQKLDEQNQEITRLQNQLVTYREKDNELKETRENISLALTAAVEKAKQIEKSSHSVYNLKIQELEVLYSRWEKVLNELVEKYPKLDEIDNVKTMMIDFRNAIKASIKEDFRFVNTGSINVTSHDPMKTLLAKMNTYLDKQIDAGRVPKTKPQIRHQLPKDMQIKQTELNKLEEKSAMIKPIYDSRINDGEKYDSLLDKFLSEEANDNGAYASRITATKTAKKENGFDLKEAVNPKDDLAEIMKSFDFYNG